MRKARLASIGPYTEKAGLFELSSMLERRLSNVSNATIAATEALRTFIVEEAAPLGKSGALLLVLLVVLLAPAPRRMASQQTHEFDET
jgi:hypothetical protein